ncbi:YceI family protein [Nocardioides xinjiangensis]|uniref:YceI family protein n=1 Tax=Nocardioides xinjiangensis TaxID=2817376 RepID=UPI001B30ED82|nr:YceI family protein [Nocardioides sp. SYSU D00514]
MTATADTLALATGRWACLLPLTEARFAVHNFGVGTVRGRIPVREASFEVDAAGEPVRLHAALDLTGIDTGNSRRDRDLRSPRLLDTERYPALAFDGGPARRSGAHTWQVPGRLTGHGAPVELVLEVTATEQTRDRCTFRAGAELDRRRLGVTAPAFLIGHRVRVEIDAAFAPPAQTSSGPDRGA